jgi:hypothetical protein
MMRKFINIFTVMLFSILVILYTGCGGPKSVAPAAPQPIVSPQNTQEGMEVQVPEWFAKPPSDPNFLYAPATFKSTDMGHSVEQARQAGRDEIARQISTKVTSMMKRFQEETGADESNAEFLSMTTTVSKSISSEVISGSKSLEQKIYKEGTKSFRAYVLMELPIGVMNSALVDKVKENQNMYTRFRASQGFQELEEEAQKYEQFKKEQSQGTAPQ